MSAKVEVSLSADQVRYAFEQLTKPEKLKLIKDFERQTWSDRFANLLERIRQRAKKHPPIPDGEIVRACREVRKELYDLTHRRRR